MTNTKISKVKFFFFWKDKFFRHNFQLLKKVKMFDIIVREIIKIFEVLGFQFGGVEK